MDDADSSDAGRSNIHCKLTMFIYRHNLLLIVR